MKQPTIDQLLDEVFERRRRGESAEGILASLPADGPARGIAADLLAVEETLERKGRPRHCADLADRVMTVLREPATTASSAWSTRQIWGATALAALSASVLLAVTLSVPNGAVPGTTVAQAPVSSPPTQAPVPDTVRHATEAYLDLVESLASTVNPAPTSRDVQLVNASPISRAIQGSTVTIRDAGQGLRAGMEPITNSAIDAFGFLWKPSDAPDHRPST
jgi:hypothetical protein